MSPMQIFPFAFFAIDTPIDARIKNILKYRRKKVEVLADKRKTAIFVNIIDEIYI